MDELLQENNEFTLLGLVHWYLTQSYDSGVQGFDINHIEKAKKLLAKAKPIIEKQGIDKGIAAYESTCETLIEEAKEQERERVLRALTHSLSGAESCDGKAETYCKACVDETLHLLKGGTND